MPVDKLDKPRNTDVDPSSITLNIHMQKVICCGECGETRFTLRRVRGEDDKKIRPARFICVECYKK